MQQESFRRAFAFVLCAAAPLLSAQTIETVAGGGVADGGPAVEANLAGPEGVAADSLGNFYVADSSNHRIRKIDADGRIHTLAGDGLPGVLNFPVGVATDATGSVYAADTYNHRVVKISPTGEVAVVAGNGTAGFSGDGGPAVTAQLNHPSGVAVDPVGNLYIADSANGRLRQVSPAGTIRTAAGGKETLGRVLSVAADSRGYVFFSLPDQHRIQRLAPGGQISTIAGSGKPGSSGDGGPATAALLRGPFGVAVDAQGQIYVSDEHNGRVRRISVEGVISTLAGGLVSPQGIAVDAAGGILVAEFSRHRIVRVSTTGLVTPVAGNGEPYYSGDGRPATNAAMNLPQGIAADSHGNLWIADCENNRVRKVSRDGRISTAAGKGARGFAGDGGAASQALLARPLGVTVDRDGNLYIADTNNHRIRKVSPDGTIRTIAGGASAGFGGDDGPAEKGLLNLPSAVAVNRAGELVVADSGNRRIRAISPSGVMRTVVANLSAPGAVAVDDGGNLWIADWGDHRVRRLSRDGHLTIVAGREIPGFSGDGGPAVDAALARPLGLALDPAGDLFIADTGNHRVRMVRPDGTISTVAGSTVAGMGQSGYAGDGGAAPGARLAGPFGVAIDADGNLAISDSTNHRVRRVLLDRLPPGPLPASSQPIYNGPAISASGAHPADAAISQSSEAPSKSLAPYVSTPLTVVQRMLEMARVTSADVVYDLGSGDGVIPITAAQRFGARAVGIELEPQLADLAARRVRELRLESRIKIIEGDLLETDLSEATVVALYLLPEYMSRLRTMLEQRLRPGTRVVSHDAEVEGWTPAATSTVIGEAGQVHTVYLYVWSGSGSP